MMRLLTYLLPIVLFVSACGSGEQKQTEASSQNTNPQETQINSQNIRTIDIIGVDQMKYVVKEEGEFLGTAGTIESSNGETYLELQSIDVKPGKKLRIRLTTISNLPASAMSHNWILLKLGVDPASFANEANQARGNDYIPKDRTDDIIAHTELAAGGETVEVTFTAPEKTGEYDYLCSFPGHFTAGMKGILNIE